MTISKIQLLLFQDCYCNWPIMLLWCHSLKTYEKAARKSDKSAESQKKEKDKGHVMVLHCVNHRTFTQDSGVYVAHETKSHWWIIIVWLSGPPSSFFKVIKTLTRCWKAFQKALKVSLHDTTRLWLVSSGGPEASSCIMFQVQLVISSCAINTHTHTLAPVCTYKHKHTHTHSKKAQRHSQSNLQLKVCRTMNVLCNAA